MSAYRCSDGTILQKRTIDNRVEKAKNEYTELISHIFHIDPNNICCERCNVNNRLATGVSRSHIISVDYCQRTGRSELAYDILNFEHLCLEDHREIESHTNDFRESWFHHRAKYILETNTLPNYKTFKNEHQKGK